MRQRPSFRWASRRTTTPEHVSTYPAEVWLIRRYAGTRTGKKGWLLLRADHDGDLYRVISRHATLAEAKQAAEDWLPE